MRGKKVRRSSAAAVAPPLRLLRLWLFRSSSHVLMDCGTRCSRRRGSATDAGKTNGWRLSVMSLRPVL
eukprot:4061358-Pyramimonas_sp.AAC.1